MGIDLIRDLVLVCGIISSVILLIVVNSNYDKDEEVENDEDR